MGRAISQSFFFFFFFFLTKCETKKAVFVLLGCEGCGNNHPQDKKRAASPLPSKLLHPQPMKSRKQQESGYGSAKGRNILFLIQKSWSLAVFCLSCLCLSPWQQQLGRSILLSLAPTQTNSTGGQKQSLLSRKQENVLSFFPYLSTATLFSDFFFSFWCIEAGANLSHLSFFRKHKRETCFIFKRLSRQPDQPYCVQVGIFVRDTHKEKANLGHWAPA